jgi:transcriptional regulator with XRE-family HTH domain
MTTTPEWLTLLRDAHLGNGEPSSRKIADTAGVSHTTVHATLTGQTRPSADVLRRIATAITDDEEQIREILASHQRTPANKYTAHKQPPNTISDDAIDRLEKCINNLAEVVHDLANALREQQR